MRYAAAKENRCIAVGHVSNGRTVNAKNVNYRLVTKFVGPKGKRQGPPSFGGLLALDARVPGPSITKQSETVDAFPTFRFLPAGEAFFCMDSRFEL